MVLSPPPASPERPEALQAPTKPVSISFSLLLAAARTVFFLCSVGIGGLLLPLQVEQMSPVNKVGVLGIGTGLTALLGLLATPLAGALSDRTASRFGRRRPWIFISALALALALALMMIAENVVTLFIGLGFFQIVSNFLLAALSALIPDQVPDEQRGTVSGIASLAIPIGSIVGAVLIGMILKTPAISYAFMIAILLIVLLPYSLFLHDKMLSREYIPSFNLRIFLKDFWIDPRKHPDFGWAWFTRFLSLLGYFMGASYLFYYLQDSVKFEQLFPGQQIVQGVSTVKITATLVMIVSTPIGGWLSDRFQRRKIFVVLASTIMAAGWLLYAFFPSWTMVLIASCVVGIGLGIYLSVSLTLITLVLPSATSRAKDLGILNIATTLPQSLAPFAAAFCITQFHSYVILFIAAAFLTLLGGFLIQPIKSVR
jgi:MFS family permease